MRDEFDDDGLVLLPPSSESNACNVASMPGRKSPLHSSTKRYNLIALRGTLSSKSSRENAKRRIILEDGSWRSTPLHLPPLNESDARISESLRFIVGTFDRARNEIS